MKIDLDSTITQQFNRAIPYEWVEANGLGGYASSTIIGANTRRYHGLLVAAEQPPIGRTVMLSKLDDSVWVDGQKIDLSCNKYGGAIYPTGYVFLNNFTQDLFPEFTYHFRDMRMKKTIFCPKDQNTTVVIYELLEGTKPVTLELLPLVAARDFHSLKKANGEIAHEARFDFETGTLSYQAYEDRPTLHISSDNMYFKTQPEWYFNFEYLEELERGQEGHEDLFSPGKLYVEIKPGQRIGIVATVNEPNRKDPLSLYEIERNRRLALLGEEGELSSIERRLRLAADQFVVKRANHLNSIIAGYHWFSDWGRDTMIALPGICLVTERYEEARNILAAFASSVDQGMIPNRFPDGQETPEYNTVDASLWFFIAIYKYYQYTQDQDFIFSKLMSVMDEIIDWHFKGTRYNIHVAEDQLLSAGEEGVQLTWMDAKAGDWIVTPRRGKAVEINALWYNTLQIYAFFKGLKGEFDTASHFSAKAESVKTTFREVFWNDELGCLYDVIGEQEIDASIRPNQLFAVSLPFPLLETYQAQQMLRVVEEHLYTPLGLRSLSPEDPHYTHQYRGDQVSRDGAYHQGVVWSWLIGPYADAVMYARGSAGRSTLEKIVLDVMGHFEEAGVGNISEIFEGEAPFKAKGCVAQAWSVAELLRIYKKYQLASSTDSVMLKLRAKKKQSSQLIFMGWG